MPCTDGSGEIDAWIMRPAGFDPSKTYPVLLNVHGGPFTQYGESFFDEAQMQAAAGFVVLMSNPRGGSGRDTAWGQAIPGPKHPKHPGTGGDPSTSTTSSPRRPRARHLPVLRCRARRHARRQLRRLHGDDARRPIQRPVQGDLLRAGRQQLVSEEFTSDIATVERTLGATSWTTPRSTRACRRSATCATSPPRC